MDSSTTAYTINNLLNQYDATTGPAAAFGYDDDGNLTDDGRYTYTWDGENRLIALERKQPRADADKRLTFQYDYLGRRVRKQVFAWATDHWQLATDESFIYNGWEVIEVVDALAGATGELLTQYTWGLDLSGGLQGAGGIGDPEKGTSLILDVISRCVLPCSHATHCQSDRSRVGLSRPQSGQRSIAAVSQG